LRRLVHGRPVRVLQALDLTRMAHVSQMTDRDTLPAVASNVAGFPLFQAPTPSSGAARQETCHVRATLRRLAPGMQG
jgi:hypothetical protein